MKKEILNYFMKALTSMAFVLLLQSDLFAQMTKKIKGEYVTDADSLKGITIHHEINFKVSPQRVYDALLSSQQFSDCTKKSFNVFTATSAKIDPQEGGAFSVFDGHIVGRILELVPNKRIVQAWRVVDWPAGVYSIARYELKPNGSGTQLIFDHVGFPEGLKEHLAIGWYQHYWDAVTKYFQEL